MTAITPSPPLIKGASTFRRTESESYAFGHFQPAKLVERVIVSETTDPPPPPLPPPPPPLTNSRTRITRQKNAGSQTSAPAPPPPPPPPVTSATKAKAPPLFLLPPPHPLPPPIKPVTPVSSALTVRPKNNTSPTTTPTSLALVLHSNAHTTPSPPAPQPLPIFISYKSYDILTSPYPHSMIHVPLGSAIHHRGRKIPFTSEILGTLKGILLPIHGLKDGTYIPQSKCFLGSPFPIPGQLERTRLYFSRNPIRATIPLSIRRADKEVNEEERAVMIPPSAHITVVANGLVQLVPVEAMWGVDLGCLKAVNARAGYLERLGVLGEKCTWVDEEGEMGGLEVVRSLEKMRCLKEELDKEKVGEKKKRVRYWAYGIKENHVAKGRMQPMLRVVIEMEDQDERKAALIERLRWRRSRMIGLQLQSSCKELLRKAMSVRGKRMKIGLRRCYNKFKRRMR